MPTLFSTRSGTRVQSIWLSGHEQFITRHLCVVGSCLNPTTLKVEPRVSVTVGLRCGPRVNSDVHPPLRQMLKLKLFLCITFEHSRIDAISLMRKQFEVMAKELARRWYKALSPHVFVHQPQQYNRCAPAPTPSRTTGMKEHSRGKGLNHTMLLAL